MENHQAWPIYRNKSIDGAHTTIKLNYCWWDRAIEIILFLLISILLYSLCYEENYFLINWNFLQINLKGLDGIQGPVYVGTGCCFNRQALYGYDPVLTEADLEPNIIFKNCCGSRKKGRSGNKKYIDKKRAMKRTESTVPIFNMEDIEEGVEGKKNFHQIMNFFSLSFINPFFYNFFPSPWVSKV